MKIVFVRALPGRVAFLDTLCRAQIPNDRPLRTVLTPHLARLIHVHGDIEIVGGEPAEEQPPVAVKARRRPRNPSKD